jgi:hypothetical protein
MKNISRSFRCLLLALVLAASARATTVIYPVGAIEDLWKYPAEEFREKYAGINITGLDVNDEGWYVRYRHENLTYLFGPIADREEARKKMWDLETVRDAAIRNRPSLSSSQVDFVKFSYSGVYGAAGNTPFTGKKGAGGQGGDGDQADGTGNGKGGQDDQGGSGTDKNGKGKGNGSGQDLAGGIGMDSQGNMIGEKLGSLDGSGQGGQGGQGNQGNGSQGNGQKGGKGSQNGQRSGTGGQTGSSGQSGQNGQMASSGGQQGGQAGQSSSQASAGGAGQSGSGQSAGSSSSTASGSGQTGSTSGAGQPSQGGGGGGSGQPGGGGNPLQLLVGLLRGILGL